MNEITKQVSVGNQRIEEVYEVNIWALQIWKVQENRKSEKMRLRNTVEVRGKIRVMSEKSND